MQWFDGENFGIWWCNDHSIKHDGDKDAMPRGWLNMKVVGATSASVQ